VSQIEQPGKYRAHPQKIQQGSVLSSIAG